MTSFVIEIQKYLSNEFKQSLTPLDSKILLEIFMENYDDDEDDYSHVRLGLYNFLTSINNNYIYILHENINELLYNPQQIGPITFNDIICF